MKSAPCFLSSPRGLILVANWLFSCQPSYVIHCHFWLTHPSVSPFQTPFTSGQENKEIFLQTARLIAGSSYHYKKSTFSGWDLPYGPTWCYCIVFYWIILHRIALHSIELHWIILIYFCFCFFFNWVYADVLKFTCSTDHYKERNLIHIKKIAKNSLTVTKE